MKIKDGFFMTEVGTDYVVIAQTPAATKIFDGIGVRNRGITEQ